VQPQDGVLACQAPVVEDAMVRALGLLPHQLAECVAGRVCVEGGVAGADQSTLNTRAATDRAVGGHADLNKRPCNPVVAVLEPALPAAPSTSQA
jgi:hypothetical protein